MTLTAQARAETDRASRYLVQLCRHASLMERGNATGRRDLPLAATEHAPSSGPPQHLDIQWSDTFGVINVDGGRCTLRASGNALLLRAEAADETTLRRLQDAVTANLTRFSRREPLTVHWHRGEAPRAEADEPAPDANRDRRRAHHITIASRKHRMTIGFGGLVALVVAVHLGLGGALVAAVPWTRRTAEIVLGVVVVTMIVGAGYLVLGRHLLRHARSSKHHSRGNRPDRHGTEGHP